jgi:flagellar basal body-associated protein FliL
MPPPPPPSKSKEDHTLLAILIIVGITVPIVAFLLYLRVDSMSRAQKPPKPPQPTPAQRAKRVGKAYQSVTTSDLSQRRPGGVSFKLDM